MPGDVVCMARAFFAAAMGKEALDENEVLRGEARRVGTCAKWRAEVRRLHARRTGATMAPRPFAQFKAPGVASARPADQGG
jgi:hypothetical protein